MQYHAVLEGPWVLSLVVLSWWPLSKSQGHESLFILWEQQTNAHDDRSKSWRDIEVFYLWFTWQRTGNERSIKSSSLVNKDVEASLSWQTCVKLTGGNLSQAGGNRMRLLFSLSGLHNYIWHKALFTHASVLSTFRSCYHTARLVCLSSSPFY